MRLLKQSALVGDCVLGTVELPDCISNLHATLTNVDGDYLPLNMLCIFFKKKEEEEQEKMLKKYNKKRHLTHHDLSTRCRQWH